MAIAEGPLMGATAAIGALGYGLITSNNKRNKATRQAIETGAQKQGELLMPSPIPPAPSALEESIQSSAAMNAAAQRVRRQKGAGYSSTLLTNPNGLGGQAPTIKKTLLGR